MITSSNLAINPNLTAGQFGYLGWAGHGNLGDDAIHEVLRAALPQSEFVAVPSYPRDLLSAARSGGLAGLRTTRLLLGGGTVIGRTNWRAHVALGMRLCAGGAPLMIGAGVEDPSFRGRRSFSSFGELRRWKHVLGRFERVTVRGPRSASLLADLGIDVEVVGDPALLVAAVSGLVREAGRVGVALGYGDALRGNDHPAVVSTVAAALRRLHREGHGVAFFIVNPSDRAHAAACVQQAGLRIDGRSVRLVEAADPSAFVSQVSTCEVIIAERLHAGILGAACGTLPVMLAYQPKVDDFMDSIGELEWSTPTDRLTADALAEQVRARSIGADEQRPILLRRVDILRAAQAKVISSIGASLRPRLRAVAS